MKQPIIPRFTPSQPQSVTLRALGVCAQGAVQVPMLAQSAADGIGRVRERVTPIVVTAATTAATEARATADRLRERMVLRRPRVAIAAPTAPARRASVGRPPRAVRQRWMEQLEEMGPDMAAELLLDVSMLNSDAHAPFRWVDAGISAGPHRHPPRAFVESWASGDDEDKLRVMRISVVVVMGFAGIAVLALWALGGLG